MDNGNRKVWAPEPTEDYYPTEIIGTCNKCKAVMELNFSSAFNFKDGDRVMERKTIPAFCEHCHQNSEFIPLPKEFQKTPTILGNAQNKKLREKGLLK